MSFTATLRRNGRTATIVMAGELDALTAPSFRTEVERAADSALDQLVLEMTDLTYLSSAGLRALVFARQKMAEGVRIVLVGITAAVEQTIRLVGFHHSVSFSDRIPD